MLTVKVTFAAWRKTRYSTRILSSHATLAEIFDWASMHCRDDEVVSEIAFATGAAIEDRLQIRIAQPELNRLSHRLFH